MKRSKLSLQSRNPQHQEGSIHTKNMALQKPISSYFTKPAVSTTSNAVRENTASMTVLKSPVSDVFASSPDFIPPTPESKRRKMEPKTSKRQLFCGQLSSNCGELVVDSPATPEIQTTKLAESKMFGTENVERLPLQELTGNSPVKTGSQGSSKTHSEIGDGLPADGFDEMDFDLIFADDMIEESCATSLKDVDPYRLGRHVVTGYVQATAEVVLTVHPEKDPTTKKLCILRDFWMHTAVKEKDVVHIHATWQTRDYERARMAAAVIDNCSGLIVVNPDVLISGTSVVASIFCARKAILAERFRGTEAPSKQMLVGTLVHRLLQTALKEDSCCKEDLDVILNRLLDDPSTLHDLYAASLSKEELVKDIQQYLPMILYFVHRYVQGRNVPAPKTSSPKKFQQRHNSNWNGRIEKIRDIEENIWSPRLGIKGKIDLTVQVKNPGSSKSKILPLELKTGRASNSAEHRGQLNLYSMMMDNGTADPVESGLLLYLKDCTLQEVPAGVREQQDLLQLRNRMVHYMTQPTGVDLGGEPVEGSLPEPIDRDRVCSSCPFLTECSIYQSAEPQADYPLSPAMTSLFGDALSHLKAGHVQYFLHWSLLLRLEWEEDMSRKRGLSDIWCADPCSREERGTCFSHLQVHECQATQFHTSEMDQFIVQLFKVNGDPLPGHSVLQRGDGVVISSDKDIAIATGSLIDIGTHSISIATDRNLKHGDFLNCVVHVDKLEYQGGQALLFSNLSRLMSNTAQAARLRSLIIDQEPPRFKPGLPREVAVAAKPIFSRLNKLQQRAVLKALTCEDYCLVNGMPGTGKTSLIVALIRLAVSLGQSVLLTSYTHSAVDNVLLKLKEFDVDFIRVGRTHRAHPDILSHTEEVRSRDCRSVADMDRMYNSVSVVAATALSMRHAVFLRRTFHLCIVDEAAQALQPAVIGPLTAAKKFVLVGDPLQLPPVVQSLKARSRGMSESLFVRLQNSSPDASIPLQLQYRMNRPINDLANKLSYNGQLQCGSPEVENASLALKKPDSILQEPVWIQSILSQDLCHSVRLLDTSLLSERWKNQSVGNASPTNETEAAITLHLLEALMKSGVSYSDVGVIAPYQSQVKLLRRLTSECDALEINTVDQYQGRDKKVVIYSCTRSCPVVNSEAASILHDDRRLTVAVTRAKHKLIVIGDTKTLKNFPPFFKLITSLHQNQIYQVCEGVDGFNMERVFSVMNL